MTYGGSRRPDLAARLRRGQRALSSRLERTEFVLALLRAAHDTLDPESIGRLVVARADEWFKASACGVFAADLDGQVVGLSSKGMGPALTPAATGVARWVLANGRELASADLRKDARAPGAAGAVLAWPLRCRAQTVGALVMAERQAATQAPHLTPAVGQLLGAMLEGPAQALDNALRLQRSEALSVTDDLTQLYNSRYLNQVLRREAKRASRSGRPLSLLFLDLDGFKGVNDNHGHQAGPWWKPPPSFGGAPVRRTWWRASGATNLPSSCPTPGRRVRRRLATVFGNDSRLIPSSRGGG